MAASFSVSAKDWKEIRVAIDPTYKPFTYKTPDGKPTGFDVKIAEALCAKIKAKCIFVEQQWDAMIPGLMARKYDTIISSMSITEDRLRQVDFSNKYYKTSSNVCMTTTLFPKRPCSCGRAAPTLPKGRARASPSSPLLSSLHGSERPTMTRTTTTTRRDVIFVFHRDSEQQIKT